MTQDSAPAIGLNERLGGVETLLDHALMDLKFGNGQTPCAACAAALTTAATELRALAGACARNVPGSQERTALRKRIAGLASRLQRLERLLAAAAEFYRGWCAVTPAPLLGYASFDCAASVRSDRPSGALVAVEG